MEPRLDIQPAGVRPGGAGWLVTWRLRNEGTEPLRLVESWLPHGKFRGDKVAHDRALAPGEAIELELPVRCAEPPGSVIENCFLILRLEGWRVLARLRVSVDASGMPRPAREVVTAQRVGLSE